MIEKSNCSPTCGLGADPATPQREIEHHSTPGNGAVKSLSECFEALEIKKSLVVRGDAAAGETRTAPATVLLVQSSESSDDDVKSPASSTVYDEPILNDNDERFCLLPVKYVFFHPLLLDSHWTIIS